MWKNGGFQKNCSHYYHEDVKIADPRWSLSCTQPQFSLVWGKVLTSEDRLKFENDIEIPLQNFSRNQEIPTSKWKRPEVSKAEACFLKTTGHHSKTSARRETTQEEMFYHFLPPQWPRVSGKRTHCSPPATWATFWSTVAKFLWATAQLKT